MKDLDAIRAAIILVTALLGSGGGLGLWKLFTGDFLAPYRADQQDLRARIAEAKADAAAADEKAERAVQATRRCEEREARLRVVLIAHGIEVGDEDS